MFSSNSVSSILIPQFETKGFSWHAIQKGVCVGKLGNYPTPAQNNAAPLWLLLCGGWGVVCSCVHVYVHVCARARVCACACVYGVCAWCTFGVCVCVVCVNTDINGSCVRQCLKVVVQVDQNSVQFLAKIGLPVMQIATEPVRAEKKHHVMPERMACVFCCHVGHLLETPYYARVLARACCTYIRAWGCCACLLTPCFSPTSGCHHHHHLLLATA